MFQSFTWALFNFSFTAFCYNHYLQSSLEKSKSMTREISSDFQVVNCIPDKINYAFFDFISTYACEYHYQFLSFQHRKKISFVFCSPGKSSRYRRIRVVNVVFICVINIFASKRYYYPGSLIVILQFSALLRSFAINDILQGERKKKLGYINSFKFINFDA